MPALDGSVGQGAQNQRHDVAVVQAALGKARGPGRKPFWPGPIDGDHPRHRRALDNRSRCSSRPTACAPRAS